MSDLNLNFISHNELAALGGTFLALCAASYAWYRHHPQRRVSPVPTTAAAGARVTRLLRYAVKGLGADTLRRVQLEPGSGFPNDRRWALRYVTSGTSPRGPAIPSAPGWRHKSNFVCAFTEGPALGAFCTAFEDDGDVLVVRRRQHHGGADNDNDNDASASTLLRANLTTSAGRYATEAFFSKVILKNAQPQPLEVVEGPHFGNTPAGAMKGDGSLHIIHIVNAATVRAVAETCGVTLHPSRFRPNIVLDGMPAWSEFDLVGHELRVGGCTLRVINRTVRCKATNYDPQHDHDKTNSSHKSTGPPPDIPALLAQHWPRHGPYLGVYAQVVDAGEVHIGDNVARVDPCALGWRWRLSHAAAACFYGVAGLELHTQGKPEWALSIVAFCLSVVWSLTRAGGREGWLLRADHAVAYLVIFGNQGMACCWPGGLVGGLTGAWEVPHVQAVVVCHIALAFFWAEGWLRDRGAPPWLWYGVLHLLWRVVGGVGSLLVARASRDSASLLSFLLPTVHP